ncbi:MAG: glycosyltransferase [Bryobacterales bacterium]|nr:glycosyltransferase [Bryobacterales bacterium]
MKLLWAGSDFLHPATRGGQIRTLEMLRQLHKRHEIHYAALADPDRPEGVARAGEYSSRAFPFAFRPARKTSPRFALEAAAATFSPLPLAAGRWRCAEMRTALERLIREERYDAMVCDFLVTAVNFPRLERAVLFQHNVESVIWQRRRENAGDPLRRLYMRLQERRMRDFEAAACRRAARVVAVSEKDAATIREWFGVPCSYVPTGIDTAYFARPADTAKGQGLVFAGSMDWAPNIDGITWFAEEVLPLIRARNQELPVTIVGRMPPAGIQALAARDRFVHVTGTVPDVRPYLWNASVAMVPLRIGGGTRLKIYEAMAAGIPVVATTIGAEGLDVSDGETIALADTPLDFARCCLDLCGDTAARARLATAAREMVASRYSWEQVAREFEPFLVQAPEAAAGNP